MFWYCISDYNSGFCGCHRTYSSLHHNSLLRIQMHIISHNVSVSKYHFHIAELH